MLKFAVGCFCCGLGLGIGLGMVYLAVYMAATL
jgi:hypothetical protein